MVSTTTTTNSAYALTAASYVIILSRILLRRLKYEKFKLDDYLMLFSMLVYALNTAAYPIIDHHGANTDVKDASLLTPQQVKDITLGSQAVIFELPFYMSYIWLMKVCILIYYTRLTSKTAELRIVKFTAVVVLITWGSNLVTFFTQCTPIQLAWQVLPKTPKCAEATNAIIAMGSTNIATDLMIMIIPLPIIFRAQLPLKTKIQLCGVFLLGLFVIMVSIMRVVVVMGHLTVANKLFWGQLECFTATIVANAPILYGLYRYRHIARDRTTRGSSSAFTNSPSVLASGGVSEPKAKTIKLALMHKKQSSWQKLPNDQIDLESNQSMTRTNSDSSSTSTNTLTNSSPPPSESYHPDDRKRGIERTVEIKQDARSLNSVDALSIAERGNVRVNVYGSPSPRGGGMF